MYLLSTCSLGAVAVLIMHCHTEPTFCSTVATLCNISLTHKHTCTISLSLLVSQPHASTSHNMLCLFLLPLNSSLLPTLAVALLLLSAQQQQQQVASDAAAAQQQPQVWFQKKITLPQHKRGCHVITRKVLSELPELSEFEVGLANLFSEY